MTKAKTSASSSYTRYFLTRFLATIGVGIGVPVCGILSFMIVLYAYASFGYVRSSPDPIFVPTAEYLYEHPQPTLDYVRIYEQQDKPICYEIAPSEHYSAFYIELYLNGVRVPQILHFFHSEAGTLERDSPIRGCMREKDLQLEKGFHLLELVLKSTPWTTYSTYQWAIKVEE